MIFSSLEFLLIFLPVSYFAFRYLRIIGRKAQILGLSLASILFYGVWNASYVPLLLASIVFNFYIGKLLIKQTNTKGFDSTNQWLVFGIAANLILLGFYKYSGFFLASLVTPIQSLAAGSNFIPLGISFYTFTQIAFLIDCWRGDSTRGSFSSYLLFVTFFPHLIAGPILHHKEMIPQFEKSELDHSKLYKDMAIGLTILSIGLAKKVLIADNLAPLVQPMFDAAGDGVPITFFEAWMGTLCYALQLYFDFSGYSDMAVGISRIFGIQIPANFMSPYKSASISEFWGRWHITLSRFLKAYLYIPLGGNRGSSFATYRNLLITMILGGMWHGAGWTFLLWGALHGVFLCTHKLWRAISHKHLTDWCFPTAVGWLVTFLAVTFAWVPFRAATLDATILIWSSMLGVNGITLPASFANSVFQSLFGGYVAFTGMFPNQLGSWSVGTLTLISGALVMALALPNSAQIVCSHSRRALPLVVAGYGPNALCGYLQWRPTLIWSAAVGVLFVLSITQIGKPTEFLYFQF